MSFPRKLTDVQAREIFSAPDKAEVLAERYSVSVSTIHHLKAGLTWRKVNSARRVAWFHPFSEEGLKEAISP